MFKKIFITVLVALAAFAAVVSRQPDEFRVARSAQIAAPASVVFAHVNNLRKWEVWSPWAKMDPAAKASYEGSASGVGASMTWDGNRKVGAGKMTITESYPNTLIRFRLDFTRPFKSTSNAEFSFKPEGKMTAVTWSMSGRANFISKAMSLFMNCDKMVGGEFEKGLADLNTVSRK